MTFPKLICYAGHFLNCLSVLPFKSDTHCVLFLAEAFEPSAKAYVIDTAISRKEYYTLLVAILYKFGAGFMS